jgi:hypothetical protein
MLKQTTMASQILKHKLQVTGQWSSWLWCNLFITP